MRENSQGIQVTGRTEPRERLDPRAKTLWRVVGAIESGVMALIGLLCAWALLTFTDTPLILGILPVLIAIALVVVLVVVAPAIRWQRWRYEIRETEVDLQRGMLYVTRTLVPLARVQHVDTQQGPLERSFGLATVIFHTAAGPNRIPALADQVAARVRDRIAELTRVQDEI